MDSGPDFDAIANSSRHGSRAKYKAGCRCDDCRAANTAYQRRRREALQSVGIGDHSEASRDEWIAPVAGVVAAVALVWAVIRKAGSN